MRGRLVNRKLNPLLASLPPQFCHFRAHQVPAITEVVEAFDAGAKVVVLEAPTGTGKTLIAETVRLMLEVDASYVCHSKSLQDQFSREFGYPVLYGRANYLPLLADSYPFEVTCEDCSGEDCDLCGGGTCPYAVARGLAQSSPVAVVNSALWLSAMQNPTHWLGRRGLTVFDEADTLEGVLMNQAEIVISPRAQERYGIKPPAKVTVEESYKEWAEETLDRLKKVRVRGSDVKAARARRRLAGLKTNVELLKSDLEEGRPWVYTGGAGSARRTGDYISFKPVTVESVGATRIWPHSPRFLLMSGTVISGGMLLRGLGWSGPYSEVRVDSVFHARNRSVVVRPKADMTRKGRVDCDGLAQVLDEVERIAKDHPDDRILVHTVSYQLARDVAETLAHGSGRPTFTYPDSRGRDVALRGWLRTEAAVLCAPSLDRGIDLYDDRCRVQIILKTPFLSLGDRQTAARLYAGPEGKIWYNVEVARTVMQMVGRGVRHEGDWCVTYILDSHFIKWRRSWGHLFPKWFSRAIRVEF